jgi:hypothetical protein
MLKYLVALAAIVLMAGPGFAQSPFQSAPGPAPPPAPRPRPAIQARPAAPPRQEEPPASVTVAPAPTVLPQPAPAPPPEPSLAGAWTQTSNCPFDFVSHPWNVVASGPAQYRITPADNATASGWISGTRVHLEGATPLSHVTLEGTVAGPTAMSGGVKFTLGGITCDWFARKK